MQMIRNGQKVSLEYTVFLEDGTQVDSNVGEDPLVFVLGSHQVFPALEQALLGLKIGDTKQITLKPEEAYGHVVNDAYREVPLETIPAVYRKEGAVLGLQDPSGGVYPIRVHQIKGEKVVLDFNHPLAGRSLRFDVKVIHADD
jgi:FKBP-type peptidyl-prolyl cis-trans isomerase SlyD